MGTLRDVGRQVRRSFHETGAGISETIGGLLGTADETSRDAMRGLDAVRMSPEEPSRLRRASDYLTQVDAPASRASAQSMGEPETGWGAAAGIGSRIAFESTPYVVSGVAGAARVPAGMSKLRGVLATEAATAVPLDLAQGYHRRPEESLASAVQTLAPESGIGRLAGRAAQSPGGRALFEAGASLPLGVGAAYIPEAFRLGKRALGGPGVGESVDRGIREGLEEAAPSWVASVRSPAEEMAAVPRADPEIPRPERAPIELEPEPVIPRAERGPLPEPERVEPDDEYIDAMAARDAGPAPDPLGRGSEWANVPDDELLDKYRQYARGEGRVFMKAEDADVASAPRTFQNYGIGGVASGTGNRSVGADWRLNAKGSRSQAQKRVEGVEQEIRARGLELPQNIYEGVGRSEVGLGNKDLVGRGGSLDTLDESGLRSLIRQTKDAWSRARTSGDLNERMTMLWERAEQSFPQLLDEFGGMDMQAVRAIARGGAGAAVGAGVDDENRLRGAAIGGAAALGAPAALRGLRGMGELGALGPRRGPQPADEAGRFYSRLQQAISRGPGQATGAEWSRYLHPAKRGYPQFEEDWTGLRGFLGENAERRLTQDDVLGFAQERGIKLGERVRGQLTPDQERRVGEIGSEMYRVISHPEYGNPGRPRAQELGDRYRALQRERDDIQFGNRPKYESYTQPGGENYQETLLQLDKAETPERQAYRDWQRRITEKYGMESVPVDRLTAAEDAERLRLAHAASVTPESSFTSPHWDEPNVLAHVRTTDRTYRNPRTGKDEKVLFIEELQSDWHQKGRGRGYRTPEPPEVVAAQKRFTDAMAREVEIEGRMGVRGPTDLTELSRELQEARSARLLANYEVTEARRAAELDPMGPSPQAVPDAPYKGTGEWTELGLKRALAQAVEGGYDRVAWASGKQAADLYDLRKQVDAIRISGDPEQGLVVSAARPGEGFEVIASNVPAAKLPDYVGKEIAQKYASEGQSEFRGVDLAVGGQGMMDFYDSIVPKTLGKYGKTIGAGELEPIHLRGITDDPGAKFAASYGVEPNPTNLSLEITPQIREALRGGQRLGFARPGLLGATARTGAGALVGAGVDDENRLRGAALGAAAANVPALAGKLRGLGTAGRLDLSSEPARWHGTIDDAIQQTNAPRTPIEADEVDDFVNVSKFALDPTGEARLREEVQNVVETHGLSPKETVSWDQTRKIAKSMGLDSSFSGRLRGKEGRLNGPEMLAIRNVVNANVRKIEEISQQLATGIGKNGEPLGADVMERMSRTISGMESQNDNLLGRFIKERSQTGRDLNNLKILANQTMEPVTWMMRAQRMADGPLPDSAKAEIRRLINAEDQAGLVKYVAGLRQSTLGEKITTVWKAGLLTGPPTHIVNMVSTGAHTIMEAAKDAPAAVYDHMLGLVTGMNTKSFNVGDLASAAKRGAARGVREARQVMRGMPTEDALRKYDYFNQVNFDSPILDGYTKFVFRALGAEDRLLRGFSVERSLGEQARTLAKMEGYRGPGLEARIQELVQNPTDEMAMRAIEDGEVATFTNRGKLGALAGNVKQTARQKGQVLGAALEVALPFTSTPANVATRVAEYSPLGAISTIPDVVKIFKAAAKGDVVPAVQRKVVERLGRSTIGSLPILAGYILHQNGLMTLGYPEDEGTRGQWSVTGKQENSILIGGKWRSLERVSPLGNLMVLGGYIHQSVSDGTKTLGEKVVAPAVSIAKTVSEQSFLEGANRALSAVMDPEREAEATARSLTRSLIPNIMQRVARIIDPTMRESDSISGEVLRGAPGLTGSQPAQVDEFGQEMEHEGGITGNLFDPFYSSTAKTDDPVRAEIDRLDAGLTQRRSRPNETPDQFRRRLQIEGRILHGELENLIGSGQYRAVPLQVRDELGQGDPRVQQLSDAIQQAMIEEVISQTRGQLTRELTRTER